MLGTNQIDVGLHWAGERRDRYVMDEAAAEMAALLARSWQCR